MKGKTCAIINDHASKKWKLERDALNDQKGDYEAQIAGLES